MTKIRITEAESIIMRALWRRQPLTAEEIITEVAGPQGWSASTVKTLVNRLLAKGAVEAEANGRRYLYSPVLSQEDHLRTESRGFLNSFFDGRLAPFLSHFSRREKLSPEDIAELKRLIEEIDGDA